MRLCVRIYPHEYILYIILCTRCMYAFNDSKTKTKSKTKTNRSLWINLCRQNEHFIHFIGYCYVDTLNSNVNCPRMLPLCIRCWPCMNKRWNSFVINIFNIYSLCDFLSYWVYIVSIEKSDNFFCCWFKIVESKKFLCKKRE